ncbi:MAG: ABC transporter substrate-binding protein [Candidatus Magasanikbacteria bacterium]|nr:ABC transporter substrate-binding protein [Candidatus Magasanikbacteria bacterium]
MVTVAQTPVMFNSFNRSDFAIVSAMVSSYNDVFVLARRDRNITKPGDLRGKKIGLTKGSTGQYFLGLFLSANNIQPFEVEEVDIPAGKLAESITAGAVDAISVWQPHIYNAEKALGDKSVVFPTRKIFREDFYFVPNKSFLQNHSEAITRFLQALIQAEVFIKNDTDPDRDNDKDEAVTIVAKRLNLDRAFVASVWGDYQFGLFLDSTIIQTLEKEAQWAIQNKLTDKTEIPKYRDFISVDALRIAAPGKVLIRQ